MRHGLHDGNAEPLVVRGTDEDVGTAVVGLELLRAHRAHHEDGVAEAERFHEGVQGRSVAPTERRADQVQPRPRVVETPVDRQHPHQVVLGLVGRHLPHEQQVGPADLLGRLQAAQPAPVGVAVHRHVDQQRRHRRGREAGLDQLALVEAGVGDAEPAARGHPPQLLPSQSRLVAHPGLPGLQELRRRDVVVVHELGFGPRGEGVEDGTADGGLIEQPTVLGGTAQRADGVRLLHEVGRAVAVEDLRFHPRLTEGVGHRQGVHPDGVPTGQ